MRRLFLFTLLAIAPLHSFALDINKACDELEEQKHSLLTKLSTSLKEANMAGQCVGYKAILYEKDIDLTKACSEFIEQKESLLGNLSTSLKEANQAGICMGAVYASCGSVNYKNAAVRIVKSSPSSSYSYLIQKIVGCNG